MTRAWPWLGSVLLIPALAAAQTWTFSDDFETGGIMEGANPPGRWTAIGGTVGYLSVTAAAARSGTYGMHLEDPVTMGSGTESAYGNKLLDTSTEHLVLAFWVRLSSTNDGDDLTLAQAWATFGQGNVAGVVLKATTRRLGLKGLDGAAPFEALSQATLDPMVWTHVELELLRDATAGASCVLRVNGAVAITYTYATLSEFKVDAVWLGMVLTPRKFAGGADYDDVQVTAFVDGGLTGDGGVTDGGTVDAGSSDAGSSDAGGSTLDGGTAPPDGGVVNDGTTPDAGAGEGHAPYGVACGCSGGVTALASPVLLVALWWRRRGPAARGRRGAR